MVLHALWDKQDENLKLADAAFRAPTTVDKPKEPHHPLPLWAWVIKFGIGTFIVSQNAWSTREMSSAAHMWESHTDRNQDYRHQRRKQGGTSVAIGMPLKTELEVGRGWNLVCRHCCITRHAAEDAFKLE